MSGTDGEEDDWLRGQSLGATNARFSRGPEIAGDSKQRDRHAAEQTDDLAPVTTVQDLAVFLEAVVLDVQQTVFHAPMPTRQPRCFPGRQPPTVAVALVAEVLPVADEVVGPIADAGNWLGGPSPWPARTVRCR